MSASSRVLSLTSPAVGRPIKVTQKDHPSTADLEEVQDRYIAELKRCVWRMRSSPIRARADPRCPARALQDLGGLQRGVRQEPHQGAHHHRMTSPSSRLDVRLCTRAASPVLHCHTRFLIFRPFCSLA